MHSGKCRLGRNETEVTPADNNPVAGPVPGAGDLTGDPFGYVTGVLAVIIHASYLVLIQKSSLDSEHGPLTAQYAIATMASPVGISADAQRWMLEEQF